MTAKSSYPNCICVGAARSGTTLLWAWMNAHPQVHMSPIKETNYFASDLIGRRGPGDGESLPVVDSIVNARGEGLHAAIVSDRQTYESLFEDATAAIRGEISPSYLYYAASVAPRIASAIPECKVLVLLREPVSRAVSNFQLLRRGGREREEFADGLKLEADRLSRGWEHIWAYRGLGLYYDQVKRYIDGFGRPNVWVVLYEDLATQPQAAFDGICEFLEIDQYGVEAAARINRSGGWTGPLSKFSRTMIGRQMKRIIPLSVQRRIVKLETRHMIDRMIKTETHLHGLKREYTVDVESLDALLPELSIRRKWGY